jgi:hypothetical protein
VKIAKNAKIEFRRFRGGRGSGTYVDQTTETNGTWISVNEGDRKKPRLIKIRPAQVLTVNDKPAA